MGSRQPNLLRGEVKYDITSQEPKDAICDDGDKQDDDDDPVRPDQRLLST